MGSGDSLKSNRTHVIKEKHHLQTRGLGSHLFTILALSSAPNSIVSPDSESFGSWQAAFSWSAGPHCSEQKVCLFSQAPPAK